MTRILDIAASERTISIAMIAQIVRTNAIALAHSVETFKRHPSYDTRKSLTGRANELSGMYHLLLKLNGYRTISDSDVEAQVTNARQAVESLYAKPGRKTR